MKTTAQKILSILLIFEAVFWIASGVYSALHSGLDAVGPALLAALMIGNGLIFAAFFALRNYEHVLLRIGLCGFIALNAVLSLTDQAGVLDYVFFAVNLAALICAILTLPRLRQA
jgi:hypothetical protein